MQSCSFTCCVWLLLCYSGGWSHCSTDRRACKPGNIYCKALYRESLPQLLLPGWPGQPPSWLPAPALVIFPAFLHTTAWVTFSKHKSDHLLLSFSKSSQCKCNKTYIIKAQLLLVAHKALHFSALSRPDCHHVALARVASRQPLPWFFSSGQLRLFKWSFLFIVCLFNVVSLP